MAATEPLGLAILIGEWKDIGDRQEDAAKLDRLGVGDPGLAGFLTTMPLHIGEAGEAFRRRSHFALGGLMRVAAPEDADAPWTPLPP